MKVRSIGWRIAICVILFLCASVRASSDEDIVTFERAKSSFRSGIQFYNKMQYLAAVEFFRKAIEIYPDYHTAREYLARSYRLAGFVEEALKEWEVLSDMTENAGAIANKINTLRFRSVPRENHDEKMDFTRVNTVSSSRLKNYRFNEPVDIAVDNERNVYITSFSTGKIVKINHNGEGVMNYNIGLQSRLYGIDIRGNKLAVSDFRNDQVLIMDVGLKNSQTVGSTGNDPGRFHGPEGLAFDREGNLFVVDSGNFRIQKFDSQGKFIMKFGSYGDREGQFMKPVDVACYENNLYVTDSVNRRISSFDDCGNFIKYIDIENLKSPRGINVYRDSLVVSDEKKGLAFYNVKNETVELPDLFKDEDKKFYRLFSSVIDRDGNLYCLDYLQKNVSVFTPTVKRYTNLDVEITSVDVRQYPVVALYVNVRDRSGNPVYGLREDNFRVTEDSSRIGRLYIDYLRDAAPSASMVMCIDRSTENSGNHDDLSWVAEFVLKRMRKNDSIKVFNFNNDFWTGNNFDWSRRRSLRAIRESNYREGRDIGKALYNSINELLHKTNRRSVILLTAGEADESSFRSYSSNDVIQYARTHFVPIHIITFGKPGKLLGEIARETGGSIHEARELDALKKLYPLIKEQEENRYVLVYYSFKVADFAGWWSDVKIDVDYIGQHGAEWGGYFVPETR